MTDFMIVLGELAYGEAVADFDEAWAELVAGVVLQQKPGEMQVTLRVSPEGGQVVIDYGYKLKVPQKDFMKTIMYQQKDGTLGRRDPRQPELPSFGAPIIVQPGLAHGLGEEQVDAETGEIKEANNGD